MTRKTQDAYIHLFNYIETHVMQLEARSFMTDFERAMRGALREVHPTASFYTCWFHFTQAVKRHATQIGGLMGHVRNEAALAKVYYQLMCLPLLPAIEIEPTFHLVKQESIAEHGNVFKTFFRYFERQWLRAVCFNNNFSINSGLLVHSFHHLLIYLILIASLSLTLFLLFLSLQNRLATRLSKMQPTTSTIKK